jgi:hypothetical protein
MSPARHLSRTLTWKDFQPLAPEWLYGPARAMQQEAFDLLSRRETPTPLDQVRLETLHVWLTVPCIPSVQWRTSHFPDTPHLKAHPEHKRQQALGVLDLVRQEKRGYTRAEHATLLDVYALIRQPDMQKGRGHATTR